MKNRIFIGEFIGSAFLVMIIVGSGIMAQNLTSDTAVMLLANTLATGLLHQLLLQILQLR